MSAEDKLVRSDEMGKSPINVILPIELSVDPGLARIVVVDIIRGLSRSCCRGVRR